MKVATKLNDDKRIEKKPENSMYRQLEVLEQFLSKIQDPDIRQDDDEA